MVTQGGVLPPKIRRDHYYGQEWSTNEGEILNYGVIGAMRFGAWTARLGLFESVFTADAQFAELITDIDPERNANEQVVAFPESRFASKSGELRLSRVFESGPRRHTLQFAARGRLQKRRYGGEDVIDVGAGGARRRSADRTARFQLRRAVARRGEAADVRYGVRAAVDRRRRDERRRAEDRLFEVGRYADRGAAGIARRAVAQVRDRDGRL